MSKKTNRSARNSDAVFIGWQANPWGKALALYNITVVDHPSYGSTVTDRELRGLQIRIPKSSPHQGRVNEFRSSEKEIDR
jgi:hypothetical protein